MWKTWGFDLIICLSTFDIPTNYDVLLPLLGFWSTELNICIFPWGTLTPTLPDVATITRLPRKLPPKVNYQHVHAEGRYPTFISKNFRAEATISDTEHTTFLMYFFCKFLYGPVSAGIVQELHHSIPLMLSDNIYAWGSVFLSNLYRGIYVLLDLIQ